MLAFKNKVTGNFLRIDDELESEDRYHLILTIREPVENDDDSNLFSDIWPDRIQYILDNHETLPILEFGVHKGRYTGKIMFDVPVENIEIARVPQPDSYDPPWVMPAGICTNISLAIHKLMDPIGYEKNKKGN